MQRHRGNAGQVCTCRASDTLMAAVDAIAARSGVTRADVLRRALEMLVAAETQVVSLTR